MNKVKDYVIKNSGFPIKRREYNDPEVLTIKITKPENRFRRSMGFDRERDGRAYYQSRLTPFTSLQLVKRPNTTNFEMKNLNKNDI